MINVDFPDASREGQVTAILHHLRKLKECSADIRADFERLNEELFGKVHEALRQESNAPVLPLFSEMAALVDSIASSLNGIHTEFQSIRSELPQGERAPHVR